MKRLLLISFITLLGPWLTSCSKGNPSDPSSNVVGTWGIEYVTYINDGVKENVPAIDPNVWVLTFSRDGTYIETIKTESGTTARPPVMYSIKDDYLYLGGVAGVKISFEGDRMTLINTWLTPEDLSKGKHVYSNTFKKLS